MTAVVAFSTASKNSSLSRFRSIQRHDDDGKSTNGENKSLNFRSSYINILSFYSITWRQQGNVEVMGSIPANANFVSCAEHPVLL